MRTLRLFSGTLLHTMSERPKTQHKHTTNITTMVMEPLAPPAAWILLIHTAQVADSLAHKLSKAAGKEFK
jgi:hypothetical protein